MRLRVWTLGGVLALLLAFAAVGLALITTVNQLSSGIVCLYQSITGDLSSIGTPAA